MNLVWSRKAWADYEYWERTDARVHHKINTLIEDILRHPFTGLGKPEPLKHELGGAWSRRLSREHRLVYRVQGNELQIVQCRYHY